MSIAKVFLYFLCLKLSILREREKKSEVLRKKMTQACCTHVNSCHVSTYIPAIRSHDLQCSKSLACTLFLILDTFHNKEQR